MLLKSVYLPVSVNKTMALAAHETAAEIAAIAIVFNSSRGFGVMRKSSSKNLEWKNADSAS